MSVITALESVLKVLDDAEMEIAAARAKKAAQDVAMKNEADDQEKKLPPDGTPPEI